MSSKNEIIKEFFRQIENFEILAGSRLSQAELSRRLNVSITPLRETLKILDYLGFINILPQSGIEICAPDLQMAKDSFQVRRMVECYNVRLFVKYGDESVVQSLLDAHIKLKDELVNACDVQCARAKLADLDYQLHELINQASRNTLITNIHKENISRIMLVQLDSLHFSKNAILSATKEHISILQAILSADPNEAAEAMDNHIVEAMHRVMRA